MKTKTIAITLAAFLLGTAASFAHSKAFKPEYVDSLLPAYFALQTALAKDDLAAAKKSAGTFNEQLAKGPSAEEAPSMVALRKDAGSIAQSTDLKAARATFLDLSDNVSELIEHVGTTGKQDVFKMRCPMAFGGKGGEWLQSTDKLANPYYGSMMYSCGTVQKRLAQKQSE